jgi:hypothetical protein
MQRLHDSCQIGRHALRMKTIASILGAATLCAALCAHAQMGGGHGAGMRGGGPPRGGENSNETGDPTPAVGLPDQLFQARMRLMVSKEQSAAWEGFYADCLALRAAGGMRPPEDMASATDAMQLQVDRAQRRDAATQKLAASFHALYEQLDANQQSTADQVLPHLLLQLPDAPQRTPRGAAAR